MTSYFLLKETNDILMKENADLKNQVYNKDIIVGRKYLKFEDTIYKKNFLFKEVKVINSKFKSFNSSSYIE